MSGSSSTTIHVDKTLDLSILTDSGAPILGHRRAHRTIPNLPPNDYPTAKGDLTLYIQYHNSFITEFRQQFNSRTAQFAKINENPHTIIQA